MAFFQFRKGRDEQPAPAAPAQTVEAMRRRAVHRLIGAAVLVLAGVIGFPLVFDNQLRPIPVDLPIEIVDKNKVKPLVAPAPGVAATTSASAAVAPAAVVAAKPETKVELPARVAVPASEPAPAVVASVAAPAPKAPPAVVPAATPVPAKSADPASAAAPAKANDASKALALLEGKDAVGDGRFIIQVGAFADLDKMREVRRKLEGAGLKTYTQVVETKDGSRTRVRVGPFADKEEALRVAEKIRKLDLSPAILTL